MSTSIDITTLIADFATLLETLSELKHAAKEMREFRTTDGCSHSVDLVVRDSVGRQIGFQKQKNGAYKAILDAHGLSSEDQKKQMNDLKKITQRYAYKKVVRELQAQGYSVAEEEKRADGAIRLLVRKWG